MLFTRQQFQQLSDYAFRLSCVKFVGVQNVSAGRFNRSDHCFYVYLMTDLNGYVTVITHAHFFFEHKIFFTAINQKSKAAIFYNEII